MPYTKQEDREPIIPLMEEAVQHIKSPGDLTYAITLLMHLVTKKTCQTKGESYEVRYSKMSAVRASAQDSADEYYHRVMTPYETNKRAENGPVSELDKFVKGQ